MVLLANTLANTLHAPQNRDVAAPAARHLEVRSPEIGLAFRVGGGAFLDFQFTVVGGPDHNRLIRVMPPRTEEDLAYGKRIYNGSREKFDREFGVQMRPSFGLEYASGRPLSPQTITAIADYLASQHDGVAFGLLPDSLSSTARANLIRMPIPVLGKHLGATAGAAEQKRDQVLEGSRPCPARLAAALESRVT